jgi:hypothetical protein
MASPSKTQGTSLLAIQNVANNTVVTSSAQDVSTKFAATVFVHIGRDVVTALTNGVNIRILASAQSSGDSEWYTLAQFLTGTATANTNAMSGSSNASGQNVLTATANINFTPDGTLIFIKNGTIANSEFARIQHVTAVTTVSLFFNLTNTQTNSNAFDHAEEFVAQLDLTAVGRIRLEIDTLSVGQAVNVEAFMVTCDSIG